MKKSVELALSLGYKKVTDNKAFKGCYLIKSNKKWIHDIDALMQYLNIKLYEDLENYHHYKDYINEMAKQEMQQIYTNITHEDGQPTYMCDGVWLYPDGTMKER
jgi:hypothetical protein